MCHTLPKISLNMKKKVSVEDDEIKIISIRPAISRNFPRISRNIEFSQTQGFSDRKPERNWDSCEASSSTNDYCDTSYYQPQLDDYNKRQQYHNYITTQQSSYRTNYDR